VTGALVAPAPPVRGVGRTHLRLLVNPFVSRLDTATAEEVARRLGGGFAVSVAHTEAPGHATELARDAARAGYDVVAALGGDGTVSEAAGGLVGSPTPLACVPAGVTNVFARAVGMPRDPLAAAERLSERARAGTLEAGAVDVGTVNGRHFLYTAGVGFTAAMAETAEREPGRKARLGQLHFAASGVGEIARRYLRDPPAMEVEAGGLRDSAVTVVVQNCQALTYFGPRQIRVCARAGLDTGSLSLTLLRRTRPGDVASVIARLLAGDAGAVERHPQVRAASGLAGATVRGAALPVDADGEFLGTFSEVVFGVEPGALRVVS
jgi:diacylglycerol kinase family enzyme